MADCVSSACNRDKFVVLRPRSLLVFGNKESGHRPRVMIRQAVTSMARELAGRRPSMDSTQTSKRVRFEPEDRARHRPARRWRASGSHSDEESATAASISAHTRQDACAPATEQEMYLCRRLTFA